MIAENCVFDAGDVDAILVVNDGDKQRFRFTPAELRKQIHACDVQASVCRTFGEDGWGLLYADLTDAMGLALDILSTYQPKPSSYTPRPGREPLDISAIKARNDIVTIAERYTQLRKSGRNFTGKCHCTIPGASRSPSTRRISRGGAFIVARRKVTAAMLSALSCASTT